MEPVGKRGIKVYRRHTRRCQAAFILAAGRGDKMRAAWTSLQLDNNSLQPTLPSVGRLSSALASTNGGRDYTRSTQW